MSAVSSSPALLREAENFTLFIKNSISFPRFKVNRFVGKLGKSAGGSQRLFLLLSIAPVTLHAFCFHSGGRAPGEGCLHSRQGLWNGHFGSP